MSQILADTFIPLVALILFGAYAGLCILLGMQMEGLVGFCVIIFMFWLTIIIIRWWHDSGRIFFPFTLTPVYKLTTRNDRRKMAEHYERQRNYSNQILGIDENAEDEEFENDTMDNSTRPFIQDSRNLFNKDGSMKYLQLAISDDPNDIKVQEAKKRYINWYKQQQSGKNKYGINDDIWIRNCALEYEKYAEDIQNGYNDPDSNTSSQENTNTQNTEESEVKQQTAPANRKKPPKYTGKKLSDEGDTLDNLQGKSEENNSPKGQK